ncbi:sugar ABC transporter substrate-binding protein [Clostridium thailandense]|uniref:sugar ABC transporter substrate-binding protein n=1 Tax=Clostridium thailandense TaxID=2794346 RepID=UPI0039895322
MFKKICTVLVACVFTFSLAACGNKTAQTSGSDASTTKNQGKKQITLGLAMAGMSSAYLMPCADFAKKEAEKNGAKMIVMDAQWDAQKQADQISNLLAQKVDAIILNPVDAKSLLPSLKKVKAAKIPVINLNMRVADTLQDYVSTYVGASMPEEAELAADLMSAALGDKGGDIVMIEGAPGSDASIYRSQAFKDKIAQNKNIKIVGIANGGWDRAKAMAAAEDLLAKNPNIVGIYCHDDNMCIGAIEAAKAAQKADKIKFIGIGGSIDGLNAITKGEMYGTVTQPPDWEGAESVRRAIDAVNGTQLKSWYRDPVEKVTKENVSKFKGLW